jgi:hypothetical protein
MTTVPIEKEAAISNVAADIVFTVLSCGIYGLFWLARQFRVVNAFLGRDKYRFWTCLLLSVVTCGIYAFYLLYIFSEDVEAIRVERGKDANSNFAVINLLLAVVGFHIISQAIIQNEINHWFD